jgi:hypothetical protein
LIKRAQEGIRHTQLIEDAWQQTGKVYGHRSHMMICLIKARPVAPAILRALPN